MPRLWPAVAAWFAANSGHNTSPSIDGPGSGASGRPPGSSSSIGTHHVGRPGPVTEPCADQPSPRCPTAPSTARRRIDVHLVDDKPCDTDQFGFRDVDSRFVGDFDTHALSPSTAGTRGPPRRPVHPQPGLFVPRVGVDDFRDQSMADHVGTGQLRDVDVVDAVEDVDRRAQPRPAAPGRSIWVTSPVTTILEPKPNPGQEHLHLLGGGVLRLVEDDERVIQRSPRMYASGATSMTPDDISFGISSGSIMSCSAS